MPYSEDYDFFWKMSTRFQIANLAEALVDYRLSSTSLNTVLKKDEYEIANELNVLRNLRYYMGESFHLSKEALECLRHNFGPMLSSYSLSAVLDTLSVMDAVTTRIMERENPNRDTRSIRGARYFKRRFIVRELASQLPFLQAVELLTHTRAWSTLVEILKSHMKSHVKDIIKLFRTYSSATRFRIFSSQAIKNS